MSTGLNADREQALETGQQVVNISKVQTGKISHLALMGALELILDRSQVRIVDLVHNCTLIFLLGKSQGRRMQKLQNLLVPRTVHIINCTAHFDKSSWCARIKIDSND
jgi:hypothetical protein